MTSDEFALLVQERALLQLALYAIEVINNSNKLSSLQKEQKTREIINIRNDGNLAHLEKDKKIKSIIEDIDN